MSEPSEKSLKTRKSAIKGALTRFNNFLSNLTDNDKKINELPRRQSAFEVLLDDFIAVQMLLQSVDDRKDISEQQKCDEYQNEIALFENEYYNILAKSSELSSRYFNAINVNNNTNLSSVTQNIQSDIVKLPVINLPVFGGSTEKWLAFSETFESLIHNNSSLNNVQKFYYLKSCLKDEAEVVISSLEVTSTNYIIAWNLLKERFQNDHLIIHNHVRALFDLPSITKDNPSILRKFIDEIKKNLRILKSFKQPVESWDTILIYLFSTKLDHLTRREWETLNIGQSVLPNMDKFLKFLSEKSQLLETLHNKQNIHDDKNIDRHQRLGQKSGFQKINDNKSFYSSNYNQKPNKKCLYCNENHLLYYCAKFLSLSMTSRIKEIKRLQLCFNCFRSNHTYDKCHSLGCKYCGEKHNSLLHENKTNAHVSVTQTNLQQSMSDSNDNQTRYNDSSNQSPDISNHILKGSQCCHNTNDHQFVSQNHNFPEHSEQTQNTKQLNHNESNQSSTPVTYSSITSHSSDSSHSEILLSTAVINIQDKNGNFHEARALLDSGSQSNFITDDLCPKLGLNKQKTNIPISGISTNVARINFRTKARIKSRFNSYQLDTTFLILNKITENLPVTLVNISNLVIPPNINLADQNFNKPGKIDILLGASVFYDLLCIGQCKLSKNQPIIQKTKFGWVLSGKVPIKLEQNISVCGFVKMELEDQLRAFWELESCETVAKLNREEEECEVEVKASINENQEGRFIVPLLTKEGIEQLGSSYETALKRFNYLEKKLDKSENLKKQYVAFMQEYEDLGHMSKIPEDEIETKTLNYYLPHHGVLKETSSTTKLRVVFDGSAKTDNGLSLNEKLKVGPTIQQDLFSILIRFRLHNIILVSDIEKMYRQVLIQKDQRDLQRILWRPDKSLPISHFRLNTVTYGTSSAPYLAIRCLHEAASRHQEEYPVASDIIKNDFYVDDMISGAKTVEEAIQIKNEVTEILSRHGFNLRKWASNSFAVISQDFLVQNYDASHIPFGESLNKTLGLYWQSNEDILQYKVSIPTLTGRVTKRSILSTISQIFDPLGLVGPCVITAKIIIQKLWKINLNWDESLPQDLHTLWMDFEEQISLINELHIPRHVILENPINIQLHGFCDSSESAYGATIYLRSVDKLHNVSVNLLCAKSKVAPLKVVSLPRLELCGAVLLANLTDKVLQALNINIDSIFYWCDSTITLSWINGEPYQWKTFVANRVSHIQSLTKINQWHHVNSSDNSSDIISRGIKPHQLLESSLWWNGPKWLALSERDWHSSKFKVPEKNPEQKTVSNVVVTNKDSVVDIFSLYSCLNKLKRIVSLILRFKHNCMNRTNKRVGVLTMTELDDGLNCLIKLCQAQTFPNDINILNNNGNLKAKNKLTSLNPFLDENKILRVGGRIKNSDFNFTHKHPIILPSNHTFTELLIRQEHYKLLHAGPQALLAHLRTRYWPISGKISVKRVLRKCIVCFRVKPVFINQLMGNLPKERITPSRPFLYTGIDYAGPFTVKSSVLKKSKLVKVFICVFICFSTKAVHIEVVNDLTANSFLNSLKRFISRRGKPVALFSDNATNFIGADHELQKFIAQIFDQNFQLDIIKYLSSESIDWRFIPARSPHFGGIWEASIKSAKFHLKRVVGTSVLNLEQFTTLTVQIEACLNSRPITPISSDPDDFQSLTPGHFLIGDPLVSIPEPSLLEIPSSKLDHYQKITQMLQVFWSRWSKEYISQLQERTKWTIKQEHHFKPGQLVLLKDDNQPPLRWKMGRIVESFPGQDNITRVVSVKTNNGVVKRAVTKICVLPIESSNDKPNCDILH